MLVHNEWHVLHFSLDFSVQIALELEKIILRFGIFLDFFFVVVPLVLLNLIDDCKVSSCDCIDVP